MSKHMKKNRSKRSALKLETLEQRQLLATIVAGSGTEVNSDVLLSNGNTYDQILLTGSTITVKADAGQVTRVDFLDADGDIIRAELSGAGELTVSLADFKAAATPAEYATDVKYVQGNASFRITGSDASTNFTLYSLGSANVNGGLSNPIFAGGTKDGGNNIANASRLVIEASDSALGSSFGGIRAANAVFSDSTGAVGIIAPDVQFQGPIIIGDIDATGNALPVLQIGQFSANKTVQVAGGDLKQTNGAGFVGVSNVSKLISSSGMNSMGTLLSTTALTNDLGVGASNISYQSSAAKVVVDGKTVTQAQLDDYAKMYLNEVELVNWTGGKVFAARLIGNVTVKGDLGGLITTDVNNDNKSDAGEFSIGNVTIEGAIVSKGAIESSTSIGNVTVGKGMDFSTNAYTLHDGALGIISTLGRADQSSAIGNVTFSGDVKLAATNVTLVAAGFDLNNAASSGDVGTITGSVLNKTGGAANLIENKVGKVGAISFTGAVDTTGAANAVKAAKDIGAISGKSLILTAINSGASIGDISASEGDITLAAVTATKAIGSISTTKGNITLGGLVNAQGGAQGAITANSGSLTITGGITTNGAIGNLTANGGDLKIDGAVTGKSIGAIQVTGDGKNLVVNNTVTANDTSIGNISVSGLKGSNINLSGGGSFSAKTTIGDVTVAGGRLIGKAGQADFVANKIGNISVTAHKDMAAGGALIQDVVFSATATDTSSADAAKASAKAASIGNVTLDASAKAGVAIASGVASTDAGLGTGFSSSGNIGNVTITASETGKLLAANTASLVIRAGNANMGADNKTLDTFAEGVNTDGGVSIGTVSISADLSGLSSGAAGTGLLVVSGADTTTAGVFVADATGGANVTTPATKTGSGGTIGALTITNYDAVTGTDVRGFANSTVVNSGSTAFTSGATIIADKIASIDVATAVDVKHYVPTGQPLKGAIALGSTAATTGGADDLYVIVL